MKRLYINHSFRIPVASSIVIRVIEGVKQRPAPALSEL